MKKILYLIVIVMILFVTTSCGSKKENNNNDIKDEYVYKDLVFKNTNITKNGDTSIITSTLTNNSDSTKSITWVVLNITKKSGEKYKMLIYFGDKIESNQTLQTTSTIDFDLNDIEKIEYEFNEKR